MLGDICQHPQFGKSRFSNFSMKYKVQVPTAKFRMHWIEIAQSTVYISKHFSSVTYASIFSIEKNQHTSSSLLKSFKVLLWDKRTLKNRMVTSCTSFLASLSATLSRSCQQKTQTRWFIFQTERCTSKKASRVGGPSAEPCGSPQWRATLLDVISFYITIWKRPSRIGGTNVCNFAYLDIEFQDVQTSWHNSF